MKQLFTLLIAATVVFCSCKDDKSATTTVDSKDSSSVSTAEDKEERNKKIIRESIEGLMAKNIDVMTKDVAPEFTDYGNGSMHPMRNMDTLKMGMQAWLNAFPDMKGENLVYVADGDYVFVWGDWSGTFKADYMGQKATNRSFKVKDVDVFKLNDQGKIVEHHNIQSPATMASQTGMKMQ